VRRVARCHWVLLVALGGFYALQDDHSALERDGERCHLKVDAELSAVSDNTGQRRLQLS